MTKFRTGSQTLILSGIVLAGSQVVVGKFSKAAAEQTPQANHGATTKTTSLSKSASVTESPSPMIAAAEYEIVPQNGVIFVRTAGSLERKLVTKTLRIPANTTLEVSHGASAKVSTSWGGSHVFNSEGAFLLPGQQRLDDVFGRMSVDGKIDAALLPPDDKNTPARRLIAFFSGELSDSRSSADNRIKSLLHPITVDSPAETHLIETLYLPVNVSLKWQVKEGQTEPHRVYIWTKEQMQYTPYTVASGGNAAVQLNKYGTYFWQVEDGSGKFSSAPRTIFVKSPGASLYPGGEANQPIRLLRPQQQTTLFACLANGNADLSLWFLHDNPKLVRYDVFPKTIPGASILSVANATDPTLRAAVVQFSKPGSYEFQIRGYEDPNPTSQAHHSAESPSWNIRVEDRCGKKRIIETFASYQTLPSTGSMVLF